MDYVHLQHHVFVHEVGESSAVCLDSPDFGGRKKYIFRLFRFEKVVYSRLVGEVKLCVSTDDDICIPLLLKLAYNCRTNHAAMPCDVYLGIF